MKLRKTPFCPYHASFQEAWWCFKLIHNWGGGHKNFGSKETRWLDIFFRTTIFVDIYITQWELYEKIDWDFLHTTEGSPTTRRWWLSTYLIRRRGNIHSSRGLQYHNNNNDFFNYAKMRLYAAWLFKKQHYSSITISKIWEKIREGRLGMVVQFVFS